MYSTPTPPRVPAKPAPAAARSIAASVAVNRIAPVAAVLSLCMAGAMPLVATVAVAAQQSGEQPAREPGVLPAGTDGAVDQKGAAQKPPAGEQPAGQPPE